MDSRFKNVASDPRFKPLRSKELHVDTDDDRFKKLLSGSAVKGRVDPRGRAFNIKEIGRVPRAQKKVVQEVVDDDSNEEEESAEESDNSVNDDAGQSDSEDGSSENSEAENSDEDKFEDDSGFDGMTENELLKHMQKGIELTEDEINSSTNPEHFKKRLGSLQESSSRFLRGVEEAEWSSDSDDESSGEEDEGELHDWAELDKDAQWDVDGNEVEETCRIAVCNIDWEIFSAQDILMILNSFAPPGGKVEKVSIYLSEFGKERLAEERVKGPTEVHKLPLVKEDNDDTTDHESMRKYHFNRLKYYYAVVEINTLEAARAIYKSVDGTSFKNGGAVDLRYIPSDMTFDEAPTASCTEVLTGYDGSKSVESTSDAHFTNTRFNWDEDKERVKNLNKLADAATAAEDPLLKNFLGSDTSDGEDDDDDDDGDDPYADAFTSVFESAEKRSKDETNNIFRELVGNLDTVSRSKETEEELLKRGMGGDSDEEKQEESEEEESEEEEDTKNLTPFERYLLKRKKREKEHKKAKKEKEQEGRKKKPKESDWDIPDDLKNDPFFKEELEIRRKEQLKEVQLEKKKKDEEFAKKESEKQQRERDIALLMLNDGEEDGGVKHFDSREAVKQAAEAKEGATGEGGRKRISKYKMAKLKLKEKRLAKEGVAPSSGVADINVGSTSSSVTLDPKNVLKDQRFAKVFNRWESNIERSHPDFIKRKTPFMEELSDQLLHKHINKNHNNREAAAARNTAVSSDASSTPTEGNVNKKRKISQESSSECSNNQKKAKKKKMKK